MQPLFRISDEMSLVLRLPSEIHLSRSSSNAPTPDIVFGHATRPSHFKVQNPLRLPRKTTSQRPKVVRTRQLFYTFDFEMCFAPQGRALFQHLNFQKWSETVSF
jgi:hypothetical protein